MPIIENALRRFLVCVLGGLCFETDLFWVFPFKEDLTQVVISYEIYETSLRRVS